MNQFQIECLESSTFSTTNHFARFSIGPLDPGQGITLGNSLRRVMLSELKASAITTLRISGIQHEFSSLKGIREDILEILLNVKEIVFEGLTETLAHGFVRVKGPCVITAQDLELPTGLKIINPNQYIATLSTTDTLEMELGIETGKGYNLVENRVTNDFVDALEVDAIFMPVRKVSYEVETLTIPEDQAREHLIMDITTNGSLTPEESIVQASQHLIKLLTPLTNPNLLNSKEQTEEVQFENVKIEDLNLSVRAYNCLKRAEINSVLDLVNYPPENLRNLKNLGQKSIDEIEEILASQFSISLDEKDS